MIRTDSPDRHDDRAVSVAVTHVLAIGITTILIVGLLTAAGGMAEEEQERSAQEQLRMIGSSMANQIERADDLGRRGANVTVRKEFQGTVSGQSYTVDFETDCDEATIETDACLVLDLTASDISTTVGVNNRSAVSFDYQGSGTVRIVSEPGGASGDAPYDPTILEQVGVGGSVYDLAPGTGALAELNKPPIAKFSVNPESPQYWDIVIFNASESSDPEANISKYIWNFTGSGDSNPGRFNMTTEDPTLAIPTGEYSKLDMNPLDAGRYQVKLTVVDPDGNKGTRSQFVKVAGLVYGGNAKAKDYNDDDYETGGLYLNLLNKHSDEEVTITEMYIDLADENIDEIHEEEGYTYDGVYYYYPYEILINNTDQVGAVEVGDGADDHIEIHDGGRIVEKGEWDQLAQVDSDGDASVHFIEFYNGGTPVDMTGRSGDLSFRYYKGSGDDKVYYSTRFNFTADSPYLKKLNPSTYSQNWEAGQKHDAKPVFKDIDKDIDIASAKVIDASGKLNDYDWEDKSNKSYVEVTQVSNDGTVQVEGNLKDVSLSKQEYLVVEVTVENDHGTQTKRLFIEIDP